MGSVPFLPPPSNGGYILCARVEALFPHTHVHTHTRAHTHTHTHTHTREISLSAMFVHAEGELLLPRQRIRGHLFNSAPKAINECMCMHAEETFQAPLHMSMKIKMCRRETGGECTYCMTVLVQKVINLVFIVLATGC